MVGWSAADMPDLTGRSAVVTGANSGLGLQTTIELARHGSAVTMACRDAARADAARDRVLALVPGSDVEVATLDLADLSSVHRFASAYAEDRGGLDLLVNNAGVMAVPRATTVDGFERQFGTNHLGHFALTGLLLRTLRARPGARVVTVSSGAAALGRIRFDDLMGQRRYQRWLAYGQAKLANQLFAFELARRAEAADLDLVSAAAHPGYAATNLQSQAARIKGSVRREQFWEVVNRGFAQSAADGALPTLYAATAAEVRGGDYFGPGGAFGMRGRPVPVSPVRAAKDRDVAAGLWQVSERLTGVRYDGLAAPA